MRAIQYIPEGVLLAVVDPGVGTDRKALALETEWGYMIGPDNGLLNLAAATVGGVTRGFELTNKDWIIPSDGSTFEGRDKFGPFAAALATSSLKIEEVGNEVDIDLLNNLLVPLTEIKEETVKGEVIWNDHYGNSQTNITPSELEALGIKFGSPINLKIGENHHSVQWYSNFQELELGILGLITDSWGMIAIAIQNGNAASSSSTHEGTIVIISSDDSI